MAKTKRVSNTRDPSQDRVRRAERIVRATPERALRAATSRSAIDALCTARRNAVSDSVRCALELLVDFLDTLARLDAPHRDDAELLQRLTQDGDHRTPTEVLQSCRDRSITTVVCEMLRNTPAGGGLNAAVLVVETGELHERVSEDPKAHSALFSRSLIGCQDAHDGEEADKLLFGETLGLEPDATSMPLFEDRERSRMQRFMPPAYVIQLYDLGGGRKTSHGPAAPIEQRVFLDFWRLPPDDRDGYKHDFDRSVEDVIDNVWPYGYDWKETEWPRVVEAFNAITDVRLQYTTSEGSVRAFRPETFLDWPEWAPRNILGSQRIRGTLTLPDGAAAGPSMSRAVLQHAGTLSGLALRMAIAWTFYRGKYFFQQGRLTAPTMPRTRRNDAGHLLDHSGNVILDMHGKPITRYTDPRVVPLDLDDRPVPTLAQAGRVPNRDALGWAPDLTLNQWRRTLYAHPNDGQRQAVRQSRLAIVRAVDLLVDSGILTAEWFQNGRPFAPGSRKHSWLRPIEEANQLARECTTLRLVPPGPKGGSPDRPAFQQWRKRYLDGKRALRDDRKSLPPSNVHPRLFEGTEASDLSSTEPRNPPDQ